MKKYYMKEKFSVDFDHFFFSQFVKKNSYLDMV